MENQKEQNIDNKNIDLICYMHKIWKDRMFLLKSLIVGCILAIIVAFSLPREYTVTVTLSPESGKSNNSNLSGVASMLGMGSFNIGDNGDALNVTLFPDILASTPFLVELLEITIPDKRSNENITLYSYLDNQKAPFWNKIIEFPARIIRLIANSSKEKDTSKNKTIHKINSGKLSKEDAMKISRIRNAILATVDKKTGITNISLTLQDPEITALVADSVVTKLQEYITIYKISKAKQDCEYLEQLYNERQKEYYEAQQKYADFVDANKNIILQKSLTTQERLEKEVDISLSVYTQVAGQLQVARAKVQEAKPVFAIVEPATIPFSPSGVGRKIIFIGFIFFTIVISFTWILFGREFVKRIIERFKQPID